MFIWLCSGCSILVRVVLIVFVLVIRIVVFELMFVVCLNVVCVMCVVMIGDLYRSFVDEWVMLMMGNFSV